MIAYSMCSCLYLIEELSEFLAAELDKVGSSKEQKVMVSSYCLS